MKGRLLFILVGFISITAFAQNGNIGSPRSSGTGPKPYVEVITEKAKTSRGLITIHKVDDRFYFEIPDSLLGKELLVVNRISKSAAGARAGFMGFAGDQISENVISFEKGPNNRVFLKSISFQEVARDSTGGLYQSVRNSNLQPIVSSFEIKAFAHDSITNVKGSVIDVTDYLMGDNEIFFFDSRSKRALFLGAYQRDNSYILDVLSFSGNTSIKTVKTYTRSMGSFSQPGVPGAPGGGTPLTFELNSSIIQLPSQPMRPRLYDPRVGYYSTGYTDFDVNPQGVEQVRMITKWRMEPKPGDVEKYLRGELVEPMKPIVFYIDPATPKKWVPYLIQGINDWQIAFEKAGFKNAIMGKEAPKNDPQWSIENAMYSAIVYKPSDIPNAEGPHVHDPRTGEILESHINWFHNVMSLLRHWYLIQTAAVDPRARNLVFSDSLMGQLIRFVASHEVGHTLGLRHNYGSSSTVPVENLRNKAWVEANGHTPSIMDYARFNYVAQPEDNISEKGLFPRIGAYDMWAIEWGYKWYPQIKEPGEELPILNRLTVEKLKNPMLRFGTESDPDDPRNQSEDLGDNAVKASTYGIKNLQRIILQLPEWTKKPDEDFTNLDVMYGQLASQFMRYMGHVSRYIGGIMNTPKTVEQTGAVVEFVSREKQKEAMQFLHDQLFKTPKWIVNPRIITVTGDNSVTTISSMQDFVLNRLISHGTFNKLLRAEAESENAYTAMEMLNDLRKGIWSELAKREAIDIYRRNLQKSYTDKLIKAITPESSSTGGFVITLGGGSGTFSVFSKTTDAMSLAKAQLRTLQAEIRAALPAYKDQMSRAHLQDLLERISQSLDPK